MSWARCGWWATGLLAASCAGDFPGGGESGDATGGSETGAGGATQASTLGDSAGPTSGSADGSTAAGSSGADSDASTGPGNLGPAAACFADVYVNGTPEFGADYDQFAPTVASHCRGTDHQDIDGIERVVFLGDSVTVGTPPSGTAAFYRSVLADTLAAEFGLSFGTQEFLWKLANPFSGQSGTPTAGDFASCAKWGGRNDDFLEGGMQIPGCYPDESRDLVTLTIITSGGNDIQSITKDAIDGMPMDLLWEEAMSAVEFKREAIAWLTDPANFPNGSFVVFGNIYEFTDGSGDVQSCNVAGLVGFDMPVPAPEELRELVIWMEEQYMEIAVESGTDMIFMLEEFCGHGFNFDNPAAPCYRGPDVERWFDLSCIHPNPTGHAELAAMFMAVVDE